MNKKQIRIDSLLEYIREHPSIDIRLLSERYSVSEMTIRRDIKYIYENGLHKQLRESGLHNHKINNRYEFEVQKHVFTAEKKKIAEHAVKLIKPHDTVLLDTGTNIFFMAELLPYDLPITVICYNFSILPILCKHENINIILAGGYFHRHSSSFESEENIQLLQRLRATKMFVSTSGIEKNGMTCYNQYEVLTKRTAIKSAIQKILLTDSGKFGVVKSSYFSTIEEMDMIITDSNISDAWKNYIREKHIDLHIV